MLAFRRAVRLHQRVTIKTTAASLGLYFLLALAPSARADVGPMDPARSACMGSPEGGPCTLDGKAGTCHGPHPSRMYCTFAEPAGSAAPQGSAGSAAAGSASGNGSAEAAPSQPSVPTPQQKKGCCSAGSSASGAATLMLALGLVALGADRRRQRKAKSQRN